MRRRLASGLLLMSGLLLPSLALAQAAPAEPADVVHRFHIILQHVDGFAALTPGPNHPAEPFPAAPLPAGGGLVLRPPNPQGEWSVHAFVFQPSQIVVRQGEPLALTFVDVKGPTFSISIDGIAEPVVIRRGEARTVLLTPEVPGRIGFRSAAQSPSMVGEILVLPR